MKDINFGKIGEKEVIIRAKEDSKYKNMLLEAYYPSACKWAKKFIDKIIYTDLVSPSKEEVNSLVYIAFEKALERFEPDREVSLSFKNYFYLMIKYQCYHELKSVFKSSVVANFKEEKKMYELEQNKAFNAEKEYLSDINAAILAQQILVFLKDKNEDYFRIIQLKIEGYTNMEICRKLSMSPMSLKSKIQYARRLIREEFSEFCETF